MYRYPTKTWASTDNCVIMGHFSLAQEKKKLSVSEVFDALISDKKIEKKNEERAPLHSQGTFRRGSLINIPWCDNRSA
jgi:hypothetical protein